MSDPYWSNVVLAMHMDGANNSTTFTDLKGKTVTPYGNAKISTTQSKFGGASAYFYGSGDYLSVPYSSDLPFGAENFTIESWVYFPSGSPRLVIWCDWRLNTATYHFYLAVSSNRKVTIEISNDLVYFNSSVLLNYDEWSHISCVRFGSAVTLYINGVSCGSQNLPANHVIGNNGTSFEICRVLGGSGTPYYSQGYIDDLRITKGVARYTSSFTPPTQAFPDSSGATNTSSMFLVF